MLTKILIFLGVVFSVFIVARMGASSALPTLKRRKQAKVEKAVEDLAPCPVCGSYGAKNDPCGCQTGNRS